MRDGNDDDDDGCDVNDDDYYLIRRSRWKDGGWLSC